MADQYAGLSKPEIQALCRGRGLPVTGTVDELTTRLRTYDQAKDQETATGGGPDGLAEFEQQLLDPANTHSDPPAEADIEAIAPVPADATAVPVTGSHDYEVGPDTSADDPPVGPDLPNPPSRAIPGHEPAVPPSRWRTATGIDGEPAVDPNPRGPNVYRQEYQVEGEVLGTEQHQTYQVRTYEAAVAAGHTPRGGMYGAARVGQIRNGIATYEIHIRRR